MESVTQKFTIPCVTQIAICFKAQGTQTGTLRQAEGWIGKGDGREVWEGGDMGIHMADSC